MSCGRQAITNTAGFVDVPATLLESRETAHNRIAALPCVKPTNARIKMLSDHAGGTSEGSK
jgi:hypothetical protein